MTRSVKSTKAQRSEAEALTTDAMRTEAVRTGVARAAPPGSPTELGERLRATGYLPDEGMATAAFLALRMSRPLLCEGEVMTHA